MSGLGVAEAIRQLRLELSTAREAAEGEDFRFRLGPIELELEVELQAGAGAKADFKWVVVSVGGEARGQTTTKHRVRLTLHPVAEGDVELEVAEPCP